MSRALRTATSGASYATNSRRAAHVHARRSRGCNKFACTFHPTLAPLLWAPVNSDERAGGSLPRTATVTPDRPVHRNGYQRNHGLLERLHNEIYRIYFEPWSRPSPPRYKDVVDFRAHVAAPARRLVAKEAEIIAAGAASRGCGGLTSLDHDQMNHGIQLLNAGDDSRSCPCLRTHPRGARRTTDQRATVWRRFSQAYTASGRLDLTEACLRTAIAQSAELKQAIVTSAPALFWDLGGAFLFGVGQFAEARSGLRYRVTDGAGAR